MLKGVNWIAALVATVLLWVLGYVWYGPLFGARWTALLGKELDTSNVAASMSLGFLVIVITVLGLNWLLRRLGSASLQANLMAALAAWFFFDFTTMAVDYIYMQQPAEFVAINMGYQLVSYLLAGAVFGLIKPKAAVGEAAHA